MNEQSNELKTIKWSSKQLLMLAVYSIALGLFLFLNGLYELKDIRHIETVHSEQVSPLQYPMFWTDTIATLKWFYYILFFIVPVFMGFVGFIALRVRSRLKKLHSAEFQKES